MHTHGVQIFNGAHDDAVVRLVAHDLHLVLFPTQERLFNQEFMGGRGLQTALTNRLKLLGVVGNPTTRAPESETGANDDWKAQALLHAPGLLQTVGDARFGRAQTNAGHGVLEFQAVFGHVDGLGCCANELHLVALEHAVVPQIESTVECGLPTHGGKNGIGPLAGDDFLNRAPGDGLNVGDIGRGRIGHDGGRIAVDQNDPVAFLSQGLASLYARVIKLTGLSDDDGASPDDQNTLEVLALRHGCGSPSGG